MSPDQFLTAYWQKQPLMQRASADFRGPVLDADEAAWLATQPDVESRLVFTERQPDRTTYRLEQGPFAEARLATLPERDWTLLIQDVEKHLPEFRQWFAAIPFIPDWRIDDLMISVAAPGGGVGPHVDNYDVFLVQVSGTRMWTTGDPGTAETDESADALALLRPFDAVERWDAGPGDVLYLPPGVPHWGVARDFCSTYSIGMRAPTRRELRAAAARVLDIGAPGDTDADESFYEDPDLSPVESSPGRISTEAVARIRRQALLDSTLPDGAVADVLGSQVTDPKTWLMPEPPDEPELPVRIHGMARIAWTDVGGDRIFVNGVSREVSASQLAVFRRWCETRCVGSDDPDALLSSPQGDDLLAWLGRQGAFDAGVGDE